MASLMLLNPRKKRRKSATRKRRYVATNPRRRRRRRAAGKPYTVGTKRVRRLKLNPRRRRRYARRNPIGGIGKKNFVGTLVPAAIGGAGAVGLNTLFAMLPLPAMLKSGIAGTAAKLAFAVVVPQLAKGVIGSRNADVISLVAAGGIAATEVAKLAGQAGVPGVAAFIPMEAYIPTMGYANPAMGVDGDAPHSLAVPYTDSGMGYMPSDGMRETDYYR